MPTEASSQAVPILGIDTHAHIFTQQLQFVSAGEGYIPDYDATLETFLQKLHQHHLSHAVLVQPSFLGTDNSHLLAAVQDRAKQLRALVIAGPETAQRDLEAMRSQGAVGARLILYGTKDQDYGSQQWKEYARRIASLGWIVEIYSESSRLRSVCEPLLDVGCRLLIDHYGRPDPHKNVEDEGFLYLLGLAKTGHVWVDTSGPYRSAPGELASPCQSVTSRSCRKHSAFSVFYGVAIGPAFNLNPGRTMSAP